MGFRNLKVDQVKVQSVRDWLAPTGIKEMQQIQGLANYYNSFIGFYYVVALLISELF